MKKIFSLACVLIILFGCSKKENHNEKINNQSKTTYVNEQKQMFSYVVNRVSHDDYYDDQEIIKETYDTNNQPVIEEVKITKQAEQINEEVNKELVVELSNIESDEEQIKKEDELIFQEAINTEINLEEMLKTNVLINQANQIIENPEDETINDEVIYEDVINEKEVIVNDSQIENQVINEVQEPQLLKGYYSPSGKYLGTTKVKVIDVSYYQGDINWDLFAEQSDCYGVILRIGYWKTEDKKFSSYIKDIKRLNIPYGIYLYSYSTTINGSNIEANFTNSIIDKYDLNPTLGIYYDIESWSTNNSSSDNITKEMYDNIISNYISKVNEHTNNMYKVKVYSGRWYAMNRLGDISKEYVDWVAEYNSTCKYDGNYSLWQYTSKGSVPGIVGNVDISYMY